jgi:hypothetical protein
MKHNLLMNVTAERKCGVRNPYQRLIDIIKFNMQCHILKSVTDRTEQRPMKCSYPSVTYLGRVEERFM